jgi:ABC-2 type transport system ATP-binding protein
MSLTVSHLTKRFGEQAAVNDISFHIASGIVGFLGPNGAGKSTTMKMIAGYLPADNGEIFICGQKMHVHNTDAKRNIGYLPEANPLYTEMYVREYLMFIASLHKLKNPKLLTEEAIRKVGLSPESHKKISQLSKGYKQRVGLAAALIHEPKVLILDEPTSGLDPNQIVEIRSVIRELGKSRTVLFSSHIMQEVESLCDRIIIINKGNIIADDSIENLKRNAGTSNLLLVEFESEPDMDFFKNLEYVDSILKLTGEVNKWQLGTSRPDLLRNAILKISLEKKLNILSLQSTSGNLETVFQSLTLHPEKRNHQN